MYNGYYYGDLGLGLFGLVEDAVIKNLHMNGASISGESAICGTVAATAYGDCLFENIKVSNAQVADYQYYAGGLVGWASGDHRYINCDVDQTTTVAAQWGDFDNSTGGVIGGCGGSATIYMKDCDVACRLDVYNDVTSTYQWYAYRRCGMLIGQGVPAAEAVKQVGMVVEGINALPAAMALARKYRIEMPIVEAAYSVVFEGMPASQTVQLLMGRDKKPELPRKALNNHYE